MGKVPVEWSMGRSFPVTIRSAPLRVTENLASGHVTAPFTAGLVRGSQVLVAVSIHGPTTEAPPIDGKVVTQESTEPTLGEDETYPSPRGTADGSTGPADVTVAA